MMMQRNISASRQGDSVTHTVHSSLMSVFLINILTTDKDHPLGEWNNAGGSGSSP